MNKSDKILLDKIAQAIYDKKGSNIIALDVRGISTLTHYFVIAEGAIDRHVHAIGKEVVARMDEAGVCCLHSDGEPDGEWYVIDYGYIVVHIFTSNMRHRYSLEKLWNEGKIIDLQFDSGKG